MLGLVYQIVGAYILFYVVFVFINWKYFKFAVKENGFFLPILPVVGTVYLAILAPLNPLGLFIWMKNRLGFPLTLWIGHKFTYITDDGDEINTIFNHPDCFNRSVVYEKINVVGKSLATVTFDIWKPLRRRFSKSFTLTLIKSFVPIFYQQSCNLLKELENLEPSIDIFELFNKYSFTNFFLASTGLDESVISPELATFGNLVHELDAAHRFFVDPITPSKLALILYPGGRKLRQTFDRIRRVTENLIDMKKQDRRDNLDFIENDKQLSLLDHIIDTTEEHFSGYKASAELVLFAVAATDTTGHTLVFCLTLLAMHPELQEAVYDEVINAIAQNEITYDNLQNLKYTEAVISETLRLYPPGSVIGRTTSSSVDIGTKIIPKGTDLYIVLYHLHRNPKYWTDPLKFDPTRFLPENASKLKPNSYFPFSGGPRNCIGKEQALLLLKISVANIVRSFKITTKYKSLEDLRLMSTLTIRTVDPLDCRFELRSK